MNHDLTARYCDVERAYACALLHLGTSDVVDAVASSDLGDPVARGIHETAVAMLKQGRPIDPVTLALEASRTITGHWQEKVPLVLTHPGAVPSNWAYYAEQVREGALRRRAVALASSIVQAAETSTVDRLNDALTAAGRLVVAA